MLFDEGKDEIGKGIVGGHCGLSAGDLDFYSNKLKVGNRLFKVNTEKIVTSNDAKKPAATKLIVVEYDLLASI